MPSDSFWQMIANAPQFYGGGSTPTARATSPENEDGWPPVAGTGMWT